MIIQLLLNVNTQKQERRHFQKTGSSSSENKADIMRFTQSVRNLNKLLDMKSLKQLDNYSSFNPSPLTIQNFIDFGRNETEQRSFTFLRQEIPVRLSNIMKEINLLPGNLLHMPSVVILQVRDAFLQFCVVRPHTIFLQDWYSQSFRDLMEFDELNHLDDQTLSKFCQTLKTIQIRHTNVVQTMAQGVLELKDSHQVHTFKSFLSISFLSSLPGL